MIRPTWSGTDEQNDLLQKAVEGAAAARRAEDESWRLIAAARNAGVPDTVLCRRTEVGRTTLHRRLGARTPQPGESESTAG